MSVLGPWEEAGTAYFRRNAKGQTGAMANCKAHEAGPDIGRYGWFVMLSDGRSRNGTAATPEQARTDADAALEELEAP